MQYKTLFRLLLKFLGVWLMANGVVSLAGTTSNWVASWVMRPSYSYPYWAGLINGMVGIALGLYLFFGGKRIVDLAIPSNRPYCHECGYDLTGAVGNVCNECGTAFRIAASPEVTSKHE